MDIWTSDGHVTDRTLEAWAAAEVEAEARRAVERHVEGCAACRTRADEWRGLFLILASLPTPEPSPSFDERVMQRVRVPARPARAAVGLRAVARWLRPAATAAAAAWSVGLVGAAAWLQTRLDVPAAALVGRLLGALQDWLLGAAIRVGAMLEVSGLAAAWTDVTGRVPGAGLAAVLALLTVASGLAIWMLYRVATYQPVKVNAHA